MQRLTRPVCSAYILAVLLAAVALLAVPNRAAAVNVPAGGLLVAPESASGCNCGYNFQTSLALVPAEDTQAHWFAFSGDHRHPTPINHLRLNLGAPGDTIDSDGHPWFAFPRPKARGTSRIPVEVIADPDHWSSLSETNPELKRTKNRWLHGSGLPTLTQALS